jgi:eukaryotic-like serine/threonine-protein kinase
VRVPDVVGLTVDEASTALLTRGLTPRPRLVDSPQEENTVVAQSPAAGTRVESGSSVRLDVARPLP